MCRLFVIFSLFPIFVFAQLNYVYKSEQDSFEVRFPEKPKILEGKFGHVFSRNYQSYEIYEAGFFQYIVTYNRNADGSPIKFTEKELPSAMEGFLKGLIFPLGKSAKKVSSKTFKYRDKYPAIEYKIKFTSDDIVLFKEGFFVLKAGKFINIAISYMPTKKQLLKQRYKVFIKSFEF